MYYVTRKIDALKMSVLFPLMTASTVARKTEISTLKVVAVQVM